MMFHQNLLQESEDPLACRIQREPDAFAEACRSLDAQQIPGADMGYAIELFEGLRVGVQFWFGDEEFLPRLRYLWDENATRYLRYETMFYAVGLLKNRIGSMMTKSTPSKP